MSKRCLFRFRIHPRWLSTTPKPKEFPKSLFSQLTPFIRFSRPEFKIIGGSLALLLISSTVTMSVPFSMGAIIDIVMQRMEEDPGIVQNQVSLPGEPAKNKLLQDLLAKTGSLTGLFGLLGGVFFVGAVANAGRQILMNLALERVITRLRNSLFTNVMRQDIQFYDKNRTGELISRLGTDSVVVGKTLTSNIADGLRGLVMSMSGITAMLYVNVNLTLTIMFIVPIISLGSAFYGRFVRKLAKETTDASAELTKVAEEKLSNIRTVRAFNQTNHEVANYQTKSSILYDLGIKQGNASALFFSTMGFSGNLIILAILYYGGSLVHLGQISIGELTSFFLYTIYVGNSFVSMVSWFSDLNKGAGASERLFSLLESKAVIEQSGGKTMDIMGKIEFKGVGFTYPTRPEAPIFKGLSFTLNPGKTVAIVGHSGCGKSTIAQLLLRFYDPDAGTITIDGIDIKDLDVCWLRESVMGIVSQEPTLFASTIMENIRYGSPNATDEQVIEAAKQANAHEFISQFPGGYNTYVGERGHAISGGQKQRLAIARAILKNPKILLLGTFSHNKDEATSALDTQSEILVQQALDRLISGRTVITIAHRLSTIEKADTICMIGNGKVIETGTYEELLRKQGPFSALVGEQLHNE